ncbi:MAG: glycosyltransferase [Actinobacteria bacterium]|nr:glycosyltransferase [Actinomycetota bacterium]
MTSPTTSDLWDLDITVVVPTRNEVDNVGPLLARIEALGVGRVLVVDDSDDGTASAVERIALGVDTKTEVMHRPPGERAGGLAGAVVAGFERSASPWCCVLDGDLQHPPEIIPELAKHAAKTGADLVVATRHNWDSINEGLTWWRRWLSWAAGRAAFRLLPAELAKVSDPLSGFDSYRCSGLRQASRRRLQDLDGDCGHPPRPADRRSVFPFRPSRQWSEQGLDRRGSPLSTTSEVAAAAGQIV